MIVFKKRKSFSTGCRFFFFWPVGKKRSVIIMGKKGYGTGCYQEQDL